MKNDENNYILLVDDEKDLREVLADLLSDEGYRVVQVQNGFKALEFLKSNPLPSLILLDYMMPVMDGREFCLERKNDLKLSKIPVILISAATLSPNVLKSLEVQFHVTKPLNIDDFLQTIKMYF